MSEVPTVTEALEKYGGRTAEAIIADKRPVTFATSLEGLEGTGKTWLPLMTWPLPMVYINFGDRDPSVLLYDKAMDGRRDQVYIYQFHAKTEEGWTRKEGNESLEAMAQIARAHLSGSVLAGGTFVIDSGSSWWDVMQECHVAPEEEKAIALANAKGKDYRKSGALIYGKANLVVSGVLNWIKNQGAFLVITHQKAQEWNKDGPIPGRFKSRINSKVPGIVEVRINMIKECAICGGQECEVKTHTGRKYLGQIVKFGHDGKLIEGITLEDPTFPMIYKLYTGKEYG